MLILGYTLAHYFIPGKTNNHKSKILHNSSILLFICVLIFYQIALRVLIPSSGVKILGYASNIPLDQVVALTNQKRLENGLTELTISSQLTEAAKAKGNDMLARDYWAHNAPDGTEPWKFFADVGYKYRYAGENLARDFSDASSAVDAWMASPSHRENMLSPKYQEIGIAVVEGDLNGVDTTIIVQLFGTKYVDTSPVIPIASAEQTESIVPTINPLPTLLPTETIKPTQFQQKPTSTPSLNIMAGSENGGSGGSASDKFQILISPFKTTKSISLMTTGVLLLVMVIDGIVVHKRRIIRISGRTVAHAAFLAMIITIVLIARSGSVL